MQRAPCRHLGGRDASVGRCRGVESLSGLARCRCQIRPDSSEGARLSSNTMRFEKLLEAVPDALVGMDQEGVIRFVNRQSELLFGYDRDQLIGEPIGTLLPEPLWQIYAEHRQDFFADPRTRSSGLEVALSGRHHNGGEFPVNVSMSHIRSEEHTS